MALVPPVSSLVFVVILAVWAVYLVQHWVRRRDHLATARSVDRFSEAMRVLERRRTLPVPEVAEQPRSYAASPLRPARPGRPEVVVKGPRVAHGATAVSPSGAQRRTRRTARLRAAGLLTGWFSMVVLVAMSMAGVVPRWSALAGVAVCALSVTLVRWSVARRRVSRRPAAAPSAVRRPVRAAGGARRAGAAAATSTSRGAGPGAAQPHRRPAPAVSSRPERRTHEFSAQSVAATLRAAPRRQPSTGTGRTAAARPYDVHAVEASLAADAAASVGPRAGEPVPSSAEGGRAPVTPVADGTWDPVPVPPPTYTLKPRAYRTPAPGSTSLPADGTDMALDEEFEDLPSVDRVG